MDMARLFAALGASLVLLASPLQAQPDPRPSPPASTARLPGQIRDIIVAQSIAASSLRCVCPEDRMSNGALCGRRSAYNRANGEVPKCYRRDVSDAEVARYRASHRQ